MDRRDFLQVTFPATLGLASSVRMSPHPESTGLWSIENKHLKVVLSGETKAGLSALTDLQSQRNFIVTAGPLYRLRLVQKGKDPVELSSLDAESLRVERLSVGTGETLTLTYGRHRSLDLTIVCTVAIEDDSPLSKWGFSVKNNTSYGIRAIHYPVVQAPLVLGDSSKDDCFICPGGTAGGGEIIQEPKLSKRYSFMGEVIPLDRRQQYPGPASLQLQAYYDGTAGLYMATHDAGINVKHFGLKQLKDGLDVSIEHNYDERPALSFDLPYETVLGVFHGDWYAAADLYKEWATKQHWCAKKVADRDDLPPWLIEPRPVLEYECRGDYYRCQGWLTYPGSDYPNGRFWPAKKVVSLSKKYVSLFGSPAVVWYNGWEKVGNPSGPVDSLPPLEGAESLKAAMDEVSKDGNIPYMAVWGNHWIYKRSGAGYDGWERFEREGAHLAALDEHGEIPKFGGAEFTWVPLCQGDEKTQQLFVDYFGEVINLGAVALEFDLQAWPSNCYSDQHGHPPGFGPWMGQRTTAFLRKIRQSAKLRNSAATLSIEGTAEPWIQDLDFMLDRPYFPGNIPLFAYIYHEYIPLMGGDGRYGVSTPEGQLIQQAANFAFGHLKFVMVGLNDYDFEVNPNYPIFELLRNMCQADRGFARDYLVLGQMLKPTQLQCATVKVDASAPRIKPLENLPDPPKVEVPRVMHSVWLSPDKKIGYVLVNWSGEAEHVKLNLIRKTGQVRIIAATQQSSVSEQQVRTGEITATVPARSVVLVEQA